MGVGGIGCVGVGGDGCVGVRGDSCVGVGGDGCVALITIIVSSNFSLPLFCTLFSYINGL